MNTNDMNMLIGDWNKHTNALEGVAQDTIKAAQDYAYQCGLERGKQNISRTIEVIEQTTKAIDAHMIGTGTELERMNGIEEAYDALNKLLDELSC